MVVEKQCGGKFKVWSKVLYSLFLLYAKLKAIQIYWNPAAFTSDKALLKNKTSSRDSLPASFSAWCWRKYLFCDILLTDQI